MSTFEKPSSKGPFDLSGGALCLDFANTWGNHTDPASDQLRAYGDVLAFARQAALFGTGSLEMLSRAADEDPERAAAMTASARELRDALYRVFLAHGTARRVDARDLDRINDVLRVARSRRTIGRAGDRFAWHWDHLDEDDLQAPLWPIVESAADLLTSADAEGIRECDANDCNWLFLDRSRGRSRRWCSMKSCGNRAKARRHYKRKRTS